MCQWAGHIFISVHGGGKSANVAKTDWQSENIQYSDMDLNTFQV